MFLEPTTSPDGPQTHQGPERAVSKCIIRVQRQKECQKASNSLPASGTPPPTSPDAPKETAASTALYIKEKKIENLQRRLENLRKQANRAKQGKSKYQQELKLEKDSSRKMASLAESKFQRAVRGPRERSRTRSFKTNGRMDLPTRELLRDLVALNVPYSSVNKVIHTVAAWLGVDITDEVSVRSVSRVVQEAEVAAKIQLADEIAKSGGTLPLLGQPAHEMLLILKILVISLYR